MIREWPAGRVKGLSVPDTITDIGVAFAQCASLTSIAIPENVIAISSEAFKGVSALTDIIIPANVARLGERAFSSCTNLNEVTFERTARPDFGGDVFEGCSRLNIIRVPQSSLASYTNYLTADSTLISAGVFPHVTITGY
jgi:hypothetical protein